MKGKFSFLKYILILSIFLTAFGGQKTVYGEPVADPEKSLASNVMILDGRTGKTLYSVNPDERIKASSILPLLVTMVATDKVSPEDYMLVSENSSDSLTHIMSVSNAGPTGLKKGERLQFSELFKAILLSDSKDAYKAVMANVAGSEQDFVSLIMKKIASLKLNNTKITSVLNPGDDDFTTVSDSAFIMKEFAQKPRLISMAGEESYTFIPNNMVPEGRKVDNTNLMVSEGSDFFYAKSLGGIISFKKPDEGMNNFVSIAMENDTMIIVSLGDSISAADSFSDATRFSEWAFKNFTTVKLISSGTRISEWPVEGGKPLELIAGKDFYFFEPKSSLPTSEFGINFIPLKLSGEIKKEQQMGNAEIIIEGKTVGEIPLLASTDVTVKPYVTKDTKTNPLNSTVVKVVLGILSLVLIVLIIRTINKLKRSKKRRQEIEKKRMLLKSQAERERWKKEQRERRSRINRSGF
ncbi:MAG: hypothetical protein QMB63_00180 [Clostridiaceae bacterium]